MMTLPDLSAAFCRWWHDRSPSDEWTLYPGMTREVAALAEWFEVCVDAAIPQPGNGVLEFVEVSVSVHVWSRPGPALGRGQQFAEQARQRLAGALIPLANSSEDEYGVLRLREPELRDLTRADRDAGRHGLQHWVVRCSGQAQTTSV